MSSGVKVWQMLSSVSSAHFDPSHLRPIPLYFLTTFATLPFTLSVLTIVTLRWCIVDTRTWDRSFDALDSFMMVRWGSNPRVSLCSRPCSSKRLCKKSVAHMQPFYEQIERNVQARKMLFKNNWWSDLTFLVVIVWTVIYNVNVIIFYGFIMFP